MIQARTDRHGYDIARVGHINFEVGFRSCCTQCIAVKYAALYCILYLHLIQYNLFIHCPITSEITASTDVRHY